MKIFGAGEMIGIPLFDALGNIIATPTPVRIGTMQEMSLGFSGDIKELYGQNTFAVEAARGKTKIDGKVKGASISGAALNTLYFGQTLTSPGTQADVYTDTTGSVIPSTPFSVTVVPPNSGTFTDDRGVMDANDTPFIRVAGTPTTGQYSVGAGGAYTFAAADVGLTVFISFRYTFANTKAKVITIANTAMGAAPAFAVAMITKYGGKRALVELNKVVASQLQFLATKQDDFNVPEFSFSGQQYNGGIGQITLSD